MQLAQTCPPAPAEACRALAAVVALVADPARPREPRARRALRTRRPRRRSPPPTAWTRREPERAEAWFYLAGAYAPLVQWRVLRGSGSPPRARARRIKDALERALALDPDAARCVLRDRPLSLLRRRRPGGAEGAALAAAAAGRRSRQGLREMLQARDAGSCSRRSRLPAPLAVSLVRARQPRGRSSCCAGSTRATRRTRCSCSASPKSSDDYLRDHRRRAPPRGRRCSTRATAPRRSATVAPRRRRARLGLAAELDRNCRATIARSIISTAVIALQPTCAVLGARRCAHLQLGDAYAASRTARSRDAPRIRHGDRACARTTIRRGIALVRARRLRNVTRAD